MIADKQKKYLRFKRGIDIVLSGGAIVVLSPVLGLIALAIKIDSPGPVLFKQKRVGKNKKYFEIYKFRTMRTDTPNDMPTHMLQNPDQFITKIGKFLRKTSLDELPQIFNIFTGKMSIIGPRPALWNQDDLIAERDKYHANDITPGLTGWAQINGRDELEIPVKAKLDGDYVKHMSFLFDIKCFFGTITSVLKHEGVVEGGTGKSKEDEHNHNKKKVLFLSNHFLTLHTFRKELLEKLSNEVYEVYISTPSDIQNKYFSKMGFNVIETEIDRRGVNLIKDISLIKDYYFIMKKIKPDIIFSYTIKPNIYGSLVSNYLNLRQVCNITGTGATFLKNNLLAKVVRFLYRISVKKSHKVFFQNTGDRDYFIEHKMIRNNYDMIPGSGVNLEEFKVTDFPSDNPISFIFIGRVMKLKGIDEYLKAAKSVRLNYSNTKFYIAGWNEELDYVTKIKEYEKKGYVEYIGFQENISEWIERCQCTILPSHGGEGVPNVLLETAASGRICIASSINGSIDVIEDGKTGFIFEQGSADDLIDLINRYLELPNNIRKKMGLDGRRKVENEFNRAIVIRKYLDEIEEVPIR